MYKIKEVVPDLFMITQTIGFGHFSSSVNVFVIAGKDGLVFDSGYGTRRKKTSLAYQIANISKSKNARGEACTITRAIASHGHWDHFSGLGHLQDVLGLNILATRKQAKKIGSKKAFKNSFRERSRFIYHPDSKVLKLWHKLSNIMFNELFMIAANIRFVSGHINIIKEDTQLSINGKIWQLIHVPGHCDDDIVLYNTKNGILLGGDIALRSITTWIGPPRSNLSAYLKSLEHLKKLPNLKLILPAHGSPINNPVKRIQEIIDHRQQRTSDLFQMVLQSGENGLSYEKIFQQFYPKSSFLKRGLLGGWILVTLQYLLDKGDIIENLEEQKIIFKVRT